MAMQGTALHQKVSRLLSRQQGKPILKPNKPLVLKNEVANRTVNKGEATCITEMSLLMACWRQNEFNDTICSKEIQSFYKCAERSQAERKAKSTSQGGNLKPKQLNTLLKRYPSFRHEV